MHLPQYIIFTRHTSTITAWVFCYTARRFGSGNRYFWFAVLLRRNQPIWWGCWNLWTFCCSRVKNNIIYIYLWIWNKVFASTTIIKIMILTQIQNKIRTLFVIDHLQHLKSFFVTCTSVKLLLFFYLKLAYIVLFPVYVSAPPCFDFRLPGVLGIAFGGFLIGVLLIGALWFIKIKTGKCFFFFYWI